MSLESNNVDALIDQKKKRKKEAIIDPTPL